MSIDRNPPPSNRQLLILLGLFVGFVLGVIGLIGWFINGLVGFIPPQVEQKLGAIIVPAYERLAENSDTQQSLDRLLDRLETHLPPEQKEGRNYRLLLLPESTVNAMALPGDAIILYAGLVDRAESENEVAMVLGHELGHFAHRDHLRSLGRILLLRMAIASIFGDAGTWGSIAGSVVESVSRSRYSQSQELAADKFGLDLLQKTYGHVGGATEFFERMSRKVGVDFAFLSTHPDPGDRVAKLKAIIQERGYPIRSIKPL
ncbi:MAG TPA: M48 family metallopeptidase [Oscillatoriales cyanobacterium M59_W2019_021]|nr:MAG: peptidase M48 [Cyanobacteria bacterium J055]HIK32949.1 M48 family metallopeptidase [Oscillatoriales cyanobacterium M4454_W2019_049]HIK52585.1 M48 family metallopeptidase [Oscillatoriales cyanobacterium M59_W2019_021]